jgi:hypothetical protein
MSYWKLEVSMKLGLLGCSRRAVSIGLEMRDRVRGVGVEKKITRGVSSRLVV